MLKRIFFYFIILMGIVACKEDDPISRRYPCRFYFYYEPHPTSLIFSAYRSPGMYVYVYSTVESNGRRHVCVQTNDKNTTFEDNVISGEKELRAPYMLGARNDLGLILGCTNFSGPVAYDRVCPNCDALTPLHWTGNRQQMECPSCKRTYDLETGAILSGDNGHALLRYGINFDGSRLSVGN
jgi:hypothetical protein